MEGADRIKVLHLNLSPPGKGGIERLLVGFFEALHGPDFDIRMCILGDDSATSRQLAERGCQIAYLHRRTDRFDWGLYPRLVRLLRSDRPDVVHIHGSPGLIFGVPACRWAGVRNVMYTCHFSQTFRGLTHRACLGGLLRRVRRPVAVSDAARRMLASRFFLPADRVEVIYNGVDLDRFAVSAMEADDPARAVTIGFCGVFRAEKQLPVLIEAFAQLRRQEAPVQLLLVGDGPMMPLCRQLAWQHGIVEAVRFTGEQTDVRPFVQTMDVFVLPSDQEAMPVALLEAMALGKAVVASAVGGIPEVVQHDASGLLVPPGDVTTLTQALRQLVSDAGLRRRLGEAGRQRIVEHFSLQKMMGRYAEIYRELAEPVQRGLREDLAQAGQRSRQRLGP